ncbi:unnamed protein product [Phytophthora lilii]|uniref:Unnamed protein product n=1 Tax=Phytophthora lilii TaxID=2077276 RepID=A0A9W7CPU9_9STRA|nr:unnamed protein product [Phytophthora lilii]
MCNTISINAINNHCGYFRGNAHRHFGNGSNCKFCKVVYHCFCDGLTTIEAVDKKYDEIMRHQQMKEESLIESAAMYPGEVMPTFEYSDYEDLDEDICLTDEDAKIKFEFTLEDAYKAFESQLGDERFYPNIDSFRLHLVEQIETVAKTRLDRLSHMEIFTSQITEELIAKAMHPSRLMKQLNNFDNIEDFFESMGC